MPEDADRFRRTPAGRGHVGKGPGGRRLCRQCGVEVPAPPSKRRTFCSDECVERWKMERWPAHARAKVGERDGGVCGSCGLDCDALQAELQRLWRRRDLEGFVAKCGELDLPHRLRTKAVSTTGGGALWEADHVVPVAEGGGCCGLEGYRTLCWRCHARETAALRKRLKR